MKRSSSADAKARSCTRKSYQRSSSDMVMQQRDVVEFEINILDDQLAEIIFKFVPMCQWSSCLEYVSKQFRCSVLKAYARVKFIKFKALFSSTRWIDDWESAPVRLTNILKKLLLVCPNLTGIAGFKYFDCCIDQSMWNILKKFDRLQSISLDNGRNGIKLKHLADFVVGRESLKNLTVYSAVEQDKYSLSLDVGTLTCVNCTKSTKTILLKNLSEKLTSLTIGEILRSFKSTCDAEQAMKMCVNLELLSVEILNINDYRILFNVLPSLCKLTNLCVKGYDRRGEVGANAFDETFCPQLDLIKNRLEIVKFCGIKLSVEVQNFLLTKCSRLQSLKVDEFSISIDVLKKLPSLPCCLKALNFSDTNGQILPLLLPKLVQLSNFTDLTLDDNFSEEWENICCLVHLRNLRLYGGNVNDSLLEKWNKKNDKMFERLVSFELIGYSCVSDVGGCLFAEKAVNLEILYLHRAKITEKTMSVVADVAKKLTKAYLIHCDFSFDENAVLRFIKKAVCLKKLKIGGQLADSVARQKDFAPFVDVIKIS